MAEEQDIKQETVEETEDTTNVEEPTAEKTFQHSRCFCP